MLKYCSRSCNNYERYFAGWLGWT